MTTRAEMKLLRQAISACRDKQGRVRPELVVKAAQNPKTEADKVLHKKFEWNTQKAAWSHWIETAQCLIREVKLVVVIEDRRIVSPYYCADPNFKSSSYIETTKIAKNDDLAEQVLLDEMTRIEGAISRARAVATVCGLSDQLQKMLAGVIEIRSVVARRTITRNGRRNDADQRMQA